MSRPLIRMVKTYVFAGFSKKHVWLILCNILTFATKKGPRDLHQELQRQGLATVFDPNYGAQPGVPGPERPLGPGGKIRKFDPSMITGGMADFLSTHFRYWPDHTTALQSIDRAASSVEFDVSAPQQDEKSVANPQGRAH